MKKSLLVTAGLLLVSGSVLAQPPAPLDVQIIFRGGDVASVTGASNEFDTMAVRPDGSTIYLFDSIGAFDGILSWNGSPAVFATEAQLAGAASAGDLNADATNVYTSIFDGSKQRIWRIPHVGGFGSAVAMVDTSGSLTVNMDEVAVDSKNSRLIISYNDAFSAATEDIVHVPLNASAATPTTLVSEATLQAAIATITGYADASADDINIYDMTVQSDGDIIASHGFSSNRQINGSLLRITETGTVSVFRTADQIIAAAGADISLVDIGSVNVEVLSDDQILILVSFSSNNGVQPPFIAVVSADGTTQTQVTTVTQMEADADIVTAGTGLIPSGQSLFRFDSKDAGQVDANDDLYFFRQGTSPSENAVLKLANVRSYLTAVSSVENWEMY